MMARHSLLLVFGFLAVTTLAADDSKTPLEKLSPPPAGKLYHGVYPGGESGDEDDLTADDLAAYEKAVGRKAAWVYFSNNWFRSREFPTATATWIHDAGAVPFIRLMLRSDSNQNKAEPLYHVKAILEGAFDDDLKKWGQTAKAFGTPLLVEWGTECNGEWFSWNGKWNGAAETKGFGDPDKADGPERFVAAYRRIVEKIRGEGATNITWVFHLDAHDAQEEEWNSFENYYPGDDVVDWIGISAYGPQEPTEKECDAFRDMIDPCIGRLGNLAPEKPVVILEFGCTAGSPATKQEVWAASALQDLLARRWPCVIGFSWWNEKWENDGDRSHDTNMRVQDRKELTEAFRNWFSVFKERIQDRPVIPGSGDVKK